MARSIQQIYDSIIAEKENQSTLNGLLPQGETYPNFLAELTSASKVAIWRTWAFITAVAHHVHELQFDLFKAEVDQTIADRGGFGTPPWYQDMVLAFQYGDELERIGAAFQYAELDVSKQIISDCAIQVTQQGTVLVKVAKQSGPLDNDESLALQSYLNKIKIAGTKIGVISQDSDQVDAEYDIYYDPLIPLNVLQANLQTALDDFLDNLPFNGELRITKLTDKLQSVAGVVDPVFKQCQVTPSGASTQNVTIRSLPVSGSFEFIDTPANMFNFIAQI